MGCYWVEDWSCEDADVLWPATMCSVVMSTDHGAYAFCFNRQEADHIAVVLNAYEEED